MNLVLFLTSSVIFFSKCYSLIKDSIISMAHQHLFHLYLELYFVFCCFFLFSKLDHTLSAGSFVGKVSVLPGGPGGIPVLSILTAFSCTASKLAMSSVDTLSCSSGSPSAFNSFDCIQNFLPDPGLPCTIFLLSQLFFNRVLV